MDWEHVARELSLPVESVQRTVELLDAGNTIPFVARFRRDQTGGLDEEQIRRVHAHVVRLRGLIERKQTILKSIESHGKLTPELAQQIQSANSPKRLEDLYLPYKPRKQTLAALARQRGLEPLAEDVLSGKLAHAQLEEVVANLVRPEKGLHNAQEVMQGVAAIIAEGYSERADLRSRLRKIVHRSGKLVSTRVEPPAASPPPPSPVPASPATPGPEAPSTAPPPAANVEDAAKADDSSSLGATGDFSSQATTANSSSQATTGDNSSPAEPQTNPGNATDPAPESHAADADSPSPAHESPDKTDVVTAAPASGEAAPATEASTGAEGELAAQAAMNAASTGAAPPAEAAVTSSAAPAGASASAAPAAKEKSGRSAKKKKKLSRQEKKQKALENSFKDYFHHQEPIGNAPPHRVLAINRGERAKVLRVRVETDQAAMQQEAESLLVPPDHPHAEFLRSCVHDALSRLVIPSLEREARRELTERAENHALEVFAKNLRGLLLQPPVSGRRVLAIDPAFKSGCRLAALDEFGNVLAEGVMHLVGREDRRQQGRARLVEMVRAHRLSVIAIGNGVASRETEQVVTEVLAKELADTDVAFVVVNEAGASIYSTSQIGREELPRFDPHVRSAISIGRRLLDPLSELVKINPANLGVGLYQHDVKSKHLEESLDAVVQSCVNFVGVEVNTASPALLSYVSGLNQLSARKLYEHRCQHGPFKSREEFKNVPGFGPATFVQAAGFLKITGGENPLDATSIHPESYPYAEKILARLEVTPEQLAARTPPARKPPEPVQPLGAKPAGKPAASGPPADSPIAQAPEADASAQPSIADAASPPATTPESAPLPESAPTSESAPATSEGSEAPAPSPPGEQPQAVAVSVAAPVETPPSSPEDHSSPADHSSPEDHANAQAPAASVAPIADDVLEKKIAAVSFDQLASELGVGKLLLEDLLKALRQPGRDPREDLPSPVFRRGLKKLEELKPGMELIGSVLNVVDFGAFVDIGLSDSGLVHISRLADRYVRDPHEVVAVGDVLKVWVVEVDQERRRVSLTAIPPGAEKPRAPRREGAPQGGGRDGRGGERPPRGEGRPPREASAGDQRPGGRPAASGRPQGKGFGGGGQAGGSRSGGQGHPQGQGARQGNRFGGGQGGRPSRPVKPPKFQSVPQPRSKPKPVKPITKAMEEGREPMRSFSDLVQFVEKKKQKPEPVAEASGPALSLSAAPGAVPGSSPAESAPGLQSPEEGDSQAAPASDASEHS